MLIKITKPKSFAKEEALRYVAQIPIFTSKGLKFGAGDVVAVSGYASYDVGTITGKGESNSGEADFALDYEIHLEVGPKWREVRDVSPSVQIHAFYNPDSHETNSTGFGVSSCIPEVTGEPASKPDRIKLVVTMHARGGSKSSITGLAYHFVATGHLLPFQDAYFDEFDPPTQ